jgi:hypothetical protein
MENEPIEFSLKLKTTDPKEFKDFMTGFAKMAVDLPSSGLKKGLIDLLGRMINDYEAKKGKRGRVKVSGKLEA